MTALPESSRLFSRQTIPRSTAGVGLIELMVVITIISLLMALAIPSYQRVQRKARASALVNDFRVFAAVFQSYAHENGSWPADALPGQIPAGITTEELQTDAWSNPTSAIGGHFHWEQGENNNGTIYTAAIAITDTPDAPMVVDLELLEEVDQSLDDGNLSTGSFILGYGDSPLYILEP